MDLAMSVDSNESEDWLAEAVRTEDLIKKYPTIFPNRHTLAFHYRNRDKNGLAEREAVVKAPTGRLLWHPKRVVDWVMGR